MYMVKITEDKLGTLTEHIEKGLRYLGKAMQCLDELQGESVGMRHGYGMREDDMNYRYPMEDDMGMREDMGYRRGRDYRGRYVRM